MGDRVARTALLLIATTTVVATVDLAHKAHVLSRDGLVIGHERSPAYMAGVIALLALWAAAILVSGSRSIALGGGVLIGGAVGNVASLLLWPSFPGVPDPLVASGVAFSIGDVAVAAGLVLVLAATAAFAVRNRARLREPVLGRR
jgi:lipoprotein signal peptidase